MAVSTAGVGGASGESQSSSNGANQPGIQIIEAHQQAESTRATSCAAISWSGSKWLENVSAKSTTSEVLFDGPVACPAASRRDHQSRNVRREKAGNARRRSTPRAHSFSLRTPVLLATQLDRGASRLPQRAI